MYVHANSLIIKTTKIVVTEPYARPIAKSRRCERPARLNRSTVSPSFRRFDIQTWYVRDMSLLFFFLVTVPHRSTNGVNPKLLDSVQYKCQHKPSSPHSLFFFSWYHHPFVLFLDLTWIACGLSFRWGCRSKDAKHRTFLHSDSVCQIRHPVSCYLFPHQVHVCLVSVACCIFHHQKKKAPLTRRPTIWKCRHLSAEAASWLQRRSLQV